MLINAAAAAATDDDDDDDDDGAVQDGEGRSDWDENWEATRSDWYCSWRRPWQGEHFKEKWLCTLSRLM